MPNLPISGLTASASNLASTDLAPVVQTVGVGPVKMTGLQLAAGLLSATMPIGSDPILSRGGSATLQLGAADAAGSAIAISSVASNQLTLASNHGLSNGAAVIITGTAAPSGTTLNTLYYARSISAAVIELYNTYQNAITTSGTTGRVSVTTAGTSASVRLSTPFQTFQPQSFTGTDIPGQPFIINGSRGTGTGAGGSIIFQVAPAGSSGTAQNAYSTALTIASNRDATFGGSITLGGASITGPSGGIWSQPSVVQLASGGHLSWASSSRIYSGGDGVILLYNNATTGFTSVLFGGTTSSFPALKRDATTLQVRLANDTGFGSFQTGGFSGGAPTIKTANYTQLEADYSLIFNGTGSITLTLLAAATYPGKILYVKTIAAQTVVSASSNVKPIDTDTAGTAILAATAGKWAMLQSDGTNWVIMAQG